MKMTKSKAENAHFVKTRPQVFKIITERKDLSDNRLLHPGFSTPFSNITVLSFLMYNPPHTHTTLTSYIKKKKRWNLCCYTCFHLFSNKFVVIVFLGRVGEYDGRLVRRSVRIPDHTPVIVHTIFSETRA